MTMDHHAPSALSGMPGLLDITNQGRKLCGIYFLCNDADDIVYIGQSSNALARVAQHDGRKRFSRSYFVPCNRHYVDAIEAALIRRFKPKLNGRYSSGAVCSRRGDQGDDHKFLSMVGIHSDPAPVGIHSDPAPVRRMRTPRMSDVSIPGMLTTNQACEFFGGKDAPLHRSTLLRGVKAGVFPAPVKLSARMNRWSRTECQAALQRMIDARGA